MSENLENIANNAEAKEDNELGKSILCAALALGYTTAVVGIPACFGYLIGDKTGAHNAQYIGASLGFGLSVMGTVAAMGVFEDNE